MKSGGKIDARVHVCTHVKTCVRLASMCWPGSLDTDWSGREETRVITSLSSLMGESNSMQTLTFNVHKQRIKGGGALLEPCQTTSFAVQMGHSLPYVECLVSGGILSLTKR